MSNKSLDHRAVKNAFLRNCFYTFFKEVFYTLNPGKEFKSNWHLKYLACLLEEIEQGKHQNIIVTVPPRSLKSTMISVAWCAWIMGRNPSKRIMNASYSSKLSVKLSVDCRNIVTSKWFLDAFPNFKLAKDQNCKGKFASTKHGFRLATSVGGTTIGEGGDVLICDDPLSPLQAHSKTYRKKVYDWYMESFSTRLDDKKKGIKIIVMQRLHEDDLCGKIIKQLGDNWKVVSIPAISKQQKIYQTDKFFKIIKENEILNEEHEGLQELEILEKQLGTRSFAAQYLQEPLPEQGELIKKQWINRYDLVPVEKDLVVQSWDLAFTENDTSDYSVCTTWVINRDGYYLAHVHRVRKDFVKLIQDVKWLYDKYDANYVIVEDTVASKAMISEIKQNSECNVIASIPRGDKFTRAAITTPVFESGKIFLPKNANWLHDYENELLNFPQVNHDDQVDSTTQFIIHSHGLINRLRKKLLIKF